MYESIAIIGISFELPDIKNWSELSQSLLNKKTSIGALSLERLQDIHNQFGPLEMGNGGFLKRIDLFDNEFFDLTERESTKMFPEHRFFMAHALRAFYDAGYSEEDLKQSNTGIFFSTSRSQYINFLDGQYDFVDMLTGIEATRVANFLDLRGPVISINTTCSSSLVAVHNACLSLEKRECDMVLVGGVRLGTITKERAEQIVVVSGKGECRPFDKDADGMMNGEGVICMILKRLADAERDNDPIYATIEGSAVNHGGARTSSLTAPSVEAQKEVIIKAWENAKVNPGDIKFIEAHGTGTILGDPIEFSGISEAFAEKKIFESTCKISSVKAQIGHLDTMCGMAGLLRLTAALNNKVIPPQANFTTINEHIEEADSIVKVQREPEHWEAHNGKRIGGVSSYGLTGTNIHMVVSHRERESTPALNPRLNFIQLSEKTKQRLDDLKKYIALYIKDHPDIQLSFFSSKVNKLYKGDKYKAGVIFSNADELIRELNKQEEISEKNRTVYMLMDLDLLSYDVTMIEEVLDENAIIKSLWDKHVGKQNSRKTIQETKVLSVLFQYVLYKYLLAILGNDVRIISKKKVGIVQQLVNNKISPEAIIRDPSLIKETEGEFSYDGFNEFVSNNHKDENIVLINFSANGNFSNLKRNVVLISGRLNAEERYFLYKKILEADKNPLKVNGMPVLFHDLHLPNYKNKRFWPEITNANAGSKEELKIVKERKQEEESFNKYTLQDIQNKVTKIWKVVLEIDGEIKEDDDFFELGGDSLKGLDMLSDIEKEFKKAHITYEEMYRYPTLKKLSEALCERMNNEPIVIPVDPDVLKSAEIREEEYAHLINSIKQSAKPQEIICKNVLVTGATGLIGSYLTKRILETTDFNITCLVRGKNITEASDRFWRIFKSNFNISNHERVKVVSGDVSKSDLMLSAEGIQLLRDVDSVYHVAGSPSFVGNPNLEEHINYRGTKNIFDWAVSSGIKYFNYVSTIGVVGKSMPKSVSGFYETDVNLGQDTTNFIHMGSKLMAEEYIRSSKSPININVFRLSNVGGNYENGIFQADTNKNLMYLKIKALSKIGSYCDEFLNHSVNLKLTPVDVMTNMICQLSYLENRILNTFHLNFEKGFTLGNVVDAFQSNHIYFTQLDKESFLNHVEKVKETSTDFSVGLSKHGTYDKQDKDNAFEVFSVATREYLEIAEVSIDYNREKYLNDVVKDCINNKFITVEYTHTI